MTGFGVGQSLLKKYFIGLDGFEEVRQLCSRDRELKRVALAYSAKFLAGEHHLPF
jgi:hypothetical protein